MNDVTHIHENNENMAKTHTTLNEHPEKTITNKLRNRERKKAAREKGSSLTVERHREIDRKRKKRARQLLSLNILKHVRKSEKKKRKKKKSS